MTKAKKQREQLEAEEQQQISLDPIAAGERYRARLGIAADKALKAVDTITGAGLAKAFEADRLYIAFSHDLAEVTQRRVYEVRWTLRERLGSEFLRRQFAALKHAGTLPTVEQSPLAKQIIQAIREQQEPKPEPTVEPVEEYQSRTRVKFYPSLEG